jgi:hypothetical protein
MTSGCSANLILRSNYARCRADNRLKRGGHGGPPLKGLSALSGFLRGYFHARSTGSRRKSA